MEEDEEPTEGHRLVNKKVKHRFETEGELKWWTGKVISQVRTRDEKTNLTWIFRSSLIT